MTAKSHSAIDLQVMWNRLLAVVEEQGQALILERTLSAGDKRTVYRKVEYKWGGVYYFKNAKSITQREYEDTFEGLIQP